MSKQDYTFLLTLVQENFSETEPETVSYESENVSQDLTIAKPEQIKTKRSLNNFVSLTSIDYNEIEGK